MIINDWSAFQARYAYPSDSGMNYDRVWELYKSGEIGGIILRYTRGIYQDVRLPEFHEELTTIGVPIAAYGVFNPYEDIGDQIAVFNATRAEYPIGAGISYVKIVGDIEIPRPDLSRDTYAALVYRYLIGIDADLIYGRGEQLNRLIGTPEWANEYDLWIARYTELSKPWGNPADPDWLKPQAWSDYYLWQFSETGDGEYYGVGSRHVDLNRLAPDVVIDPDPEPEPCELPRLKVTAWRGLNVRSHPRLGFNVVGYLQNGDIIEVLEIDPQQFGRVWVRHSGGWSAMEYGVKLMGRV